MLERPNSGRILRNDGSDDGSLHTELGPTWGRTVRRIDVYR